MPANVRRHLHFDCHCGVAGDMTVAAMIDLGVPREKLQSAVRSLGLPKVELKATEVKKNGFRAVHLKVEHPPEHAHRHLSDIHRLIDAAAELDEPVRQRAKSIFQAVAVAEAKVHGSTIEKVHFHEVGAVDSIADIVATAVGWDHLQIESASAGTVVTGAGTVKIAHGHVSVPAPATLEILRGVPIEASDIDAELTTPTGAAIVASQCESFDGLPAMVIDRIGYGAGTMDVGSRANVLRLVLGFRSTTGLMSDEVCLLETNIDDCSPETVASVCERLRQAGAIDVWQTPCTMKKGRAGIVVSVLVDPSQIATLESILFRQTTTIGIRRHRCQRSKLPREAITVSTRFGDVAAKKLTLPGGDVRIRAEQDAVAATATKKGVTEIEVRQAAEQNENP